MNSSFSFLILSLIPILSISKQILLTFINDQPYTLSHPTISFTKGLHKSCFASLKAQETGTLLMETDVSQELSGYVSIKPESFNFDNFIHLKVSYTNDLCTISIALNPRTHAEIIDDDAFEFEIIDTTWKTLEFENTWIFDFYASDREGKVHFRYEPKLKSEEGYVIKTNNLQFDILSFNVTVPGDDDDLNYLYTNLPSLTGSSRNWKLLYQKQSTYMIQPTNQEFLPFLENYACVKATAEMTLTYANCRNFDDEVLWEIKIDVWGRWTIRSLKYPYAVWSASNSLTLSKVTLVNRDDEEETKYFYIS